MDIKLTEAYVLKTDCKKKVEKNYSKFIESKHANRVPKSKYEVKSLFSSWRFEN